MSKIKAFIEAVSVDMGHGGEINEEVLIEADKRMKDDEQRALFVSKSQMRRLNHQLNDQQRSNHPTRSKSQEHESVDQSKEETSSERT